MPMVSVQLYQKRKWVRKERGLSSVLARLWLLDTVSCHPPPNLCTWDLICRQGT